MQTSITIQGIDEAMAHWLAAEAQKKGVNENEIVLELIHRQINAEKNLPTFHELDDLFGTWSQQDADEFIKATQDFGRIDKGLWR